MKTDSEAWKQLQEKGAAQLRTGFSDRVLRASKDPSSIAWQLLQDRAAAQLRPGFAERVLRAVRAEVPSFFGQFAVSAATAAVCLIAVVYLHDRSTRIEDERSMADWQQLMADSEALGLNQ